MDGNYNYSNPNINGTGKTSVWVGGGPTNIAMEPLVDQFGNLRFNNQIIPLTTPVAPFINQTPSLPNLTTSPIAPLSPVMPPQTPGPFYVVSVQESPPANVVTDPIANLKPHTLVQNENAYTTVGINQPTYSEENGNVVSVSTGPPRQVINGAHPRQRFVSNPEIQPLQPQRQRRVSAPEPNPSPFRGQPYMKQLAIDHSNGEVIRIPEQDVPPLTSAKYMTQLPIGEGVGIDRQIGSRVVYTSNGSVNDGTDTSSMSSTSVSPYSSMPSSPRPDPQGSSSAPITMENKQVYDPVPPRYVKPSDNSRCLMCDKIVYAMEKRGPIKDVLFHKGCFRCAVCNMTLDLKNFCQNDNDLADLNVYCKSHKPSEKFGKLDAGALSINRALQAPRLSQVNDQIRGGPVAMRGGKMDANALNIKSALNAPKPNFSSGENVRRTSHNYNIDNEAVSLVHARSVPATELQGANKIRQQVWSRDDRKAEGVPPPDVIRYDSEIQGYGGEPYRHDPPPEGSYKYT